MNEWHPSILDGYTGLMEERKDMRYSYPGVEAGENLFNSNCCRSDSVDCIHNVAGILILGSEDSTTSQSATRLH